jgi:hypothetical protein
MGFARVARFYPRMTRIITDIARRLAFLSTDFHELARMFLLAWLARVTLHLSQGFGAQRAGYTYAKASVHEGREMQMVLFR